MEKMFNIFEHRRQGIEEKLELLVELDRILFAQVGPYVLEWHEQMQRRINAARVLLPGRLGKSSRLTKTSNGGR